MPLDETYLSLIVITWNSGDVLHRCVNSLTEFLPIGQYELILVDNCSESTEYLKEYIDRPATQVLFNPKNLGYAKAANIGLRRAKGTHLVILNPDIFLKSNIMPKLLAAMERDPTIGVIGPMLEREDGTPQIEGYYPLFPTPAQFVLNHSILAKTKMARNLSRRFFHSHLRPEGLQSVDQIPGAFLFFKRSLFDGNPALNEAFFIWMEDVDFCLRVHEAGLRVVVDVDARATHTGGTSFQMRASTWKREAFTRSYHTYIQIHSNWLERLLFKIEIGLDSLARMVRLLLGYGMDSAYIRQALMVEGRIIKLVLGRR